MGNVVCWSKRHNFDSENVTQPQESKQRTNLISLRIWILLLLLLGLSIIYHYAMEDEVIDIPVPAFSLADLFPVPVKYAWSTSHPSNQDKILNRKERKDLTKVQIERLDDGHLGVHHISVGTTHKRFQLADGTRVWEAFYVNGSYTPSGPIRGGFGLYLGGPKGKWKQFVDQHSQITMSYAVYFEEGFDFVKGGKLPGLFGGEGSKALKCSGGRQDERCSCFNLRLMWRAQGKGELYTYLPLIESNKERLLRVPGSHANTDYGVSVGRGTFTFVPGQWTTIAQRIKLNDLEADNGEIELWVNGTSVIKVDGLIFRCSEQSCLQGMHFQTFFGGSTPEWATPKDQRAWFTGISGGVIADE